MLAIRYILVLAIILCCTITASAQQQQVALTGSNQTLKNIFSQIEAQTNLSLDYSTATINDKQLVSKVPSGTLSVNNALKELLAASNIDIIYQGNHIILKDKPVNNTIVKGKVVNRDNSPVIGANVILKGTTTGTVTDMDGQFAIDAKNSNTIEISYLGYLTQDININSQSFIAVTLMDDATDLDEIIVVGYGVVRKSDLTGSVTRVDTETLSNTPVTSIDKALQGRAAGVQISSISGEPGAGTSVRIRGGNSISADNEPLYVIDGFIGGGDLNSINPADIESVEILKDAASTAIYGSRGANGVIMITTKKGKDGVNKVNASFYQGFQSLPRELPFMDGQERAQYANDYADYNNTTRPFSDVSAVTNTDWQDLVTRVAPMTNADFSISGGTQDFQHFISVNYLNQEGIYKSSSFDRYQARMNLDKRLASWLKVGVQTNVSATHTDNPKFSYTNYVKEASTACPVYDEDGNYSYINPISNQTFTNPIANIDLELDDTYKKRYLGNFYAEITPVKNLIIRSTVGGDFRSAKTEQYSPSTLPVREATDVGGFAYVSNYAYFSFLNENTVSYMWDIKDDHKFTVMGGMTVQTEEARSSNISVAGFTTDAFTFNNLTAGDSSTATYGSSYTASQMLSFIGRLNYSFKDKYLLTLTSRYDGSSRLAANNKWAFFPSAAAAWRLSEEDFIKDMGVFHNLKLRASYGIVGNQAIDEYESLASLSTVTPTLGGSKAVGYVLGNIENKDLKWETTKQVDIGIDAAFLGGRLSMELDYYYKKTSDLLMEVEIPWVSGFETQLQNVGEVENKGVELMVNATIVNTKDWHFSVNMNIARNRNKVLDINDEDYLDVTTGVRLYKGLPAGTFVGAVYDGTWKSQEEIDASNGFMSGVLPGCARFKDVNGNGVYDGTGDYAVLGSAEADFFGGFGASVAYKGLSLDLFFQGSYGNEIYNTGASSIFFGSFGSNLFELDGEPWSEDNPTSNIPAAGAFNYSVNVNDLNYSVAVQDGSYLKLKTLKLAYQLPQRIMPFTKNTNVYVLCSNLFTLTNYTWGYDPDVTTSATTARGIDGMAYPQNRSVQIGINMEF